ncbi:unnamed protein product, partial [Linum tenue]
GSGRTSWAWLGDDWWFITNLTVLTVRQFLRYRQTRSSSSIIGPLLFITLTLLTNSVFTATIGTAMMRMERRGGVLMGLSRITLPSCLLTNVV